MKAYFPIEWDFGDNPCDGLVGPVPENDGAIYVYDDDEDSDNFEELIEKTTLDEMVEDLILGHASPISGKVVDEDSVRIVNRLKAALSRAIDRLEQSTQTSTQPE